jgi:hypothetical protein
MITFWKNVACTAAFTAVKVPCGQHFAVSCRFGTGVAVFPVMTDAAQTQPAGTEADQVARLLELELIQRRTAWKQAKERKKSFRTLAFFFLFLLFMACVGGAFFAFTRVNEQRQNRPPPAATSHP